MSITGINLFQAAVGKFKKQFTEDEYVALMR